MEPYKNLAGNSGVLAFEIGPDYIEVVFQGGAVYRYDYDRPGPDATEDMKGLAEAGRGLSTYISQIVQDGYAERLQ